MIVFFDGDREEILFDMSFDALKLSAESSEKALRNLLQKRVKSDYIAQLITLLKKGVEYNKQCTGKTYDECQYIAQHIDIVYDYSTKQAKVLVNPKGLKKALLTRQYYEGRAENNALINSISLVTDMSLYEGLNEELEHNVDSSLYGESILGLGYGYLEADYQFNDDSRLDKLAYKIDLPGYYVGLGYFVNDAGFTSSFGLFPQTASIGEKFSVGISSSENLSLNKNDSGKLLTVYSPVDGTLKLNRNGRLLKLLPVKIGFLSVPYGDLPRGIYELELEFSKYGKVAESYKETIYNINAASAGAPTNYSLFFSNHELNGGTNTLYADYIDDYFNGMKVDDINYLEFVAEQNIADGIMFSQYFSLADTTEQAYGLGVSYVSTLGASLQSSVRFYSNKDMLSSFNVNYKNVNFSYTSFNVDASSASRINLSNYFHGGVNETTATASYNARLFDQLDMRMSVIYSELYQSSNLSSDVEFGYKFSNDWQLGLGVGYSDATYSSRLRSPNEDGEYSATLSISIPLFGSMHFDNYSYYSESGLSTANYLEYSDENIDRAGLRVTTNSDGEIYEGYLDNRFDNESVGFSYGVSAAEGRGYANVYVENTQILSSEGVRFTREKSASYTLVKPQIQGMQEDKEVAITGFSVVTKDNIVNEVQHDNEGIDIVPMEVYQSYSYQFVPNKERFVLDWLDLPSDDYFSMPGSLYLSKPVLLTAQRRLVKLTDMFGKLTSGADCLSNNCFEANEITPGVYQIYSAERQILLSAQKSICSVNPLQDEKVSNGFCFADVKPFEKFESAGKEYIFITAIESRNETKLAMMIKEFGDGLLLSEFNENITLVYQEYNPDIPEMLEQLKRSIVAQSFRSISAVYEDKIILGEMNVKN